MKTGAIVSLAIAAIVFAAPSQSFADVPASAAGLSKAIFAEIDALARQTRTSGTLPHWSDDAQRAVLARFWDEDALLGQPPHTSAEVPLLLDIGDSHAAMFKT